MNKIKVHLGCGTVYLEGYDNVDVPITEHQLADNNPDIVEQNSTTVDNYYTRHVDKGLIMGGTLHKTCVVVDKYGDVFNLPYEDNTIDELRLVQVFEHLTFEQGQHALRYWLTKLKPGGILHLDVPDLDGTVALYATEPEWATRLLFGSQRNEYGQHKSMYNKQSLRTVAEEVGYIFINYLPNIHFYPAFAIEFAKSAGDLEIEFEGQGYKPEP